MWDIKCLIIPAITGANKIVKEKKNLTKNLEAVLGKHSVYSVKKKELYLEHHT
jgi:hypothetical protein